MFYQICRNTSLCRAEFYQADMFIASQAQAAATEEPQPRLTAQRGQRKLKLLKLASFHDFQTAILHLLLASRG